MSYLYLIHKSDIIVNKMVTNQSFLVAKEIIFQDAIQRDITTARRSALLEIIWNERYLTRAQLIVRVELRLGKGCFGSSAWQDTFYRDMRIVKKALQASGFSLLYNRNRSQSGYYLEDQPALSPELKQMLKSSAKEVDQHIPGDG